MDETGAYYTEWSKLERKALMQYIYIKFRKMLKITVYMRQQKRHRCKEQILDSVEECESGMIWENSIETCTLPYVK